MAAKLFLGGLDRSSKEEEISQYFAKFGKVKEVVVIRDRTTGHSRGFGFVEFTDPNSANKALNKNEEHIIANKKIDVKKAFSPACAVDRDQDQHSPQHMNTTTPNKIFIGGLSNSITQDVFESYFGSFGRITDAIIMRNSSTRRPRGFGFVTYDSEEAVHRVLQWQYHQLGETTVEVKTAVPKGSIGSGNSASTDYYGYDQGSLAGYYEPRYQSYTPLAPSLRMNSLKTPVTLSYGMLDGTLVVRITDANNVTTMVPMQTHYMMMVRL